MKIIIQEKAREMLRNKLEADQFLRVVVTEGGCAGLTYSADIDREMKEGESVILQSGDIRVVSDPESSQYLDGLTIDYSDDLIGGGLQFTNEHAGATCGCGSSFNLSGFPVVENGKCGKG
ncbi:MAG: iron-sulfur cluster assembly accessory protein [Thermodesulfobacteriota bacterium]|nr:iron-sulfur cluster assembly accessory protein [Thermodesulfobacteriota bacterium]